MIDKFRVKFVEEALDNVHDLEEALLLLEDDKQNKEIIERIFRAMHSLKGGGAMFGFNDLSDFTHHLETAFDWVRNGKLAVTNNIISVTLQAIDHIKYLLNVGDITDQAERIQQKAFIERIQTLTSISGGESQPKKEQPEVADVADDGSKSYLIYFEPDNEILKNGTNLFYLIDDLNDLGSALSVPFIDQVPTFSEIDPVSNYCRWQIILNTASPINEIKDVFIFVEDECRIDIVEIAKGDITQNPYLLQLIQAACKSGVLIELQSLKSLVGSTSDDYNDEGSTTKRKSQLKEHKISSIRVASNKVDELVTLVSELVTTQAQLSLYAETKADPIIISLAESVQKLSRQLRDNAFEISLIPLQNELMRFQRLVRDLSKDLGKEIDFVIEGGDIELDKNIIEHLTDPLLHIIRNSIDHGIEMPNDRIKQGKSPKGTINFKAYYSGATVVIKVSDDGKGLDTEFIRKRAIERGLIDKNQELSRNELFDLLFVSGFSTKDQVTDVSGRGVGMDVVKKKIGEIRGEVIIDSTLNVGTTTTLELPLTLSIIDGLLIKVAHNSYVISISSVMEIFEMSSSKKGSTNKGVVTIGSEQYSIIDLREIFEDNLEERGTEQIILVKYEDRSVGLIVDEVVGEYQTVVKPLGRYLKFHETISGASILGDGSIAFVIDTNRLIHYSISKKMKLKL